MQRKVQRLRSRNWILFSTYEISNYITVFVIIHNKKLFYMVLQKCQKNTSGPFCEECAESFYGDPDFGGCTACPCPAVDKKFSSTCIVDSEHEVACHCKTGTKIFFSNNSPKKNITTILLIFNRIHWKKMRKMCIWLLRFSE